MRRLATAFLIVLATLASAGGAWKKFKSPDGSFSVSFPTAPMYKRVNKTYKNVQIPFDIWASVSGRRAFSAMLLDFTGVDEARGRERELLTFGVAGLSKEKGYQIFSQDDFSIGSVPGKHIVLRKGPVEEQVYVVARDQKCVMIIAAAENGKSVDADINKFVASFKLN